MITLNLESKDAEDHGSVTAAAPSQGLTFALRIDSV